jgi:hypothetical protein
VERKRWKLKKERKRKRKRKRTGRCRDWSGHVDGLELTEPSGAFDGFHGFI